MANQGLKVPIEVTMARLERQLQQVTNRVRKTATGMQDDFEKANVRTERSFKRSGFAVANLSAQINDVGVSLAGGQSPFQVMIQQGSQISQIFQQTGGNFKEFTQLAKGSVLGIINPFSLATFAIIGFGGALVQWLTQTDDVAKDTETAIKDLETAIGEYEKTAKEASSSTEELADKYGLAVAEARALLELQRELAAVDAVSKLADALEKVGSETDSFFSTQQYVKDLKDDIESIYRVIQSGDFGESFEGRFINQQLALVQQLENKFNATNEQAEILFELFGRLGQAEGPKDQLDVFNDMLPKLRDANGGIAEMSDEVRTVYSELLRAANSAAVLAGEATEIAPGLQEAAEAARTLAEDLSTAVDGMNNLVSSAKSKLVSAELELKYKNDPVSLAKAKAELSFNEKVGDFSGFDPIVRDVFEKQKDDLVALAERTAIAKKELSDYRKEQAKLNRARNRREKESPDDKFDKKLLNSELRVKSLMAEYEALSVLDPLVKDYGYSLAYNRAEQELLNEAEKLGIQLTPERIAAIEAVSQATAEQTVKLEQMRESHQNIREALNQFSSTSKNVFKGFIQDLQNGKSASEALENALGKIHNKILDIAVDAVFNDQVMGTIMQAFTGGFGGTGRPIPGKAEGGFTGYGHKHKVTGFHHAGEYVLRAAAVNKIGLKTLDRLNRAGAGMANGGYTGGSAGSGFTSGGLKIEVNNYRGSDTEVSTEFDPKTGLAKIAVNAVKEDFGNGGFDNINRARFGNKPNRTRR